MATREDGALMVQLLSWGTQMGLDEALRRLFAGEYDPEAADMEDPAIGKVLTFGETVGTLVKHDLLDRELVMDLLWVEGIWVKVAPQAKAARQRFGEPRLYENFEALVGQEPVT